MQPFKGTEMNMKDFKLVEYNPEESLTETPCFYVLSRGTNTGEPRLNPSVNSYAFYCKPEHAINYFLYIEKMAHSGVFNSYLQFDGSPYISIRMMHHVIDYTISAIEKLEDLFETLFVFIDEEEYFDSILSLLECMNNLIIHKKLELLTAKTGCAADKEAQ